VIELVQHAGPLCPSHAGLDPPHAGRGARQHNRRDEGAINVVMQRLHADDLVAHLQETECRDLLSCPLVAEREEHHELATPYGRRRIHRRADEVLHPALLSASAVEGLRRSVTEYNFAAQYQRDPQPPSGLIVRREWLKFYRPNESTKDFEQIVQSWDTANKATELSDYSVCSPVEGDSSSDRGQVLRYPADSGAQSRQFQLGAGRACR
jgi:hypothetical protein